MWAVFALFVALFVRQRRECAADLINGGSFVCSNGHVHNELLELLKA